MADRGHERRHASRTVWLAALLLTVGGRTAWAQLYTVLDVTPPGEEAGVAQDVNNSGQVIVNGRNRAYLWENGAPVELGVPGSSYTFATDINDVGQVVGGADMTGLGGYHTILWQSGVLQDLGVLGGRDSYGVGINRHGQIVGRVTMPDNWQHAFRWRNGAMEDLDQTANGFRFNFARRVNDAGWVIGDTSLPAPALVWRNGVITVLGTLGGGWSSANGINEAGQIVGRSQVASGADRAFLWQNGAMQDLGVLPGMSDYGSVAYDINNSGQVVGNSGSSAFLYTAGQMQDLNALIPSDSGWRLTTAWGLNDYGQIVASGRFNGQSRAVLLNPPAPSAPAGLTASVHSGSEVRLAWSDTSPLETAFALWRRDGAGAYARIAVLPPNAGQYLDTGLQPGVTYSYRVRAIGLSGASAWTEEAAALIPTTPPAAPAGLTAQALSGTRVSLTWTDGSSHETGFGIWRRTGSGEWARVGVAAQNATAYVDSTAVAGVVYTYRLRAHNNYGASAWTNEAAVTTPGSP